MAWEAASVDDPDVPVGILEERMSARLQSRMVVSVKPAVRRERRLLQYNAKVLSNLQCGLDRIVGKRLETPVSRTTAVTAYCIL
jgi:hypothetical protein